MYLSSDTKKDSAGSRGSLYLERKIMCEECVNFHTYYFLNEGFPKPLIMISLYHLHSDDKYVMMM